MVTHFTATEINWHMASHQADTDECATPDRQILGFIHPEGTEG